MHGDHLRRAVGLASDPDWRAAMAGTGVDAVEQLPRVDPVEPFRMLPLRALWLVRRIARNVEEQMGANPLEILRPGRNQPEIAGRRRERPLQVDDGDIAQGRRTPRIFGM